MYNPNSKRLAPLRILQILYKYSDSDHPLLQEDIAHYLEKDYNMQLERKAISRNLDFLRDAGFAIESIPKYGSYISGREFSDYELRLLMEAVLSSERIESEHAKELTQKIKKLGNQSFHSGINKVRCVDERSEKSVAALFTNISEINRKIAEQQQIQFDYIRTDAIRGKIQEECYVIPRQLILHNHKYYLLAYNGKNIVFYDLENMFCVRSIIWKQNIVHDPGRDKGAEQRAIENFIKDK